MPLAPVSALYYPHINIASLTFAKSVLLYWEHLDRIVPTHYRPGGDAQFVQDLPEGFLRDVRVQGGDYASFTAMQRFLPRLDRLLEARGGNFHNTTVEKFARTTAEVNQPRPDTIHVNKMDERLVEHLRRTNLIVGQDGPWLEMDPVLAGLYMMCLAGVISEERYAPMVTDHPDADVASAFFNHGDSRIDPVAEDELALARVLCPFPSDTALDAVSLQQVLQIREKYAKERLDFRDAVHSFASDLASVPQAGRADIVATHRKNIEIALAGQKATLRSLNIGSLDALVCVSIPTVAAALPKLGASPLLSGVLAVAGVSVSVASLYFKRRADRQAAKNDFPWQYLLSLKSSQDSWNRRIEREIGTFNSSLFQFALD